MKTNNEILAKLLRDSVRDDGWSSLIDTANAVIEALEVADQLTPDTDQLLKAAHNRNDRVERKAAKANSELTKIKQENAQLRLANNIQLGWLNAEDSYTRRYNALEARFNIIRDIVSDEFPEKYGQPGAYNGFKIQSSEKGKN